VGGLISFGFSVWSFARKHALEIALVLLFCVIPFNIAYHFDSSHAYVEGRFVNYLDFVVHITDVGVAVWVVCAIWFGRLWRERRYLYIGILVCAFTGFLWVVFPEPIVLYSAIRMVLYILGAAALAFSVSRKWRKEDQQKLFAVLFIVVSLCVAFQSVVGILQFSTDHTLGLSIIGESQVENGGTTGSSVYLSDGYHLRGYGTFPHPNVLGGYLVVSLVFLFFLSEKLGKKFLLPSVSVTCIALLGIFSTWSRVAWMLAVAVVVSMLFRVVMRLYRRYMAHALVTCCVATGVVCAFVLLSGSPWAISVRGRLLEQSSSSDISVIERRDLGNRAVDMVRTRPWTGVGLGRFIIESSNNPVYTQEGIRIMQPAHNVFLLALAEVGIVGVGLLCVILFMIFRCVQWSYYVFISAVVILVIGLFDHYLWTLPQGMMLYFPLVFVSMYVGEKASLLKLK
jgi:O-antigen ligase